MDFLIEVGTGTLIGQDVDFTLQQGFKLLAELDEIEQTAIAIHFDKEIDITVWTRLSPRHGPEDPHVVGTMYLCEAQNFSSFEFE